MHTTSWRLLLGPTQQPVLRRADERVPAGVMTTVEGEDHPALVAVVPLPPARVRHRLLRVLVGQVVEVVVRYLDGETVVPRPLRQSTWQGPGAEHPVLLQPQVEVVPRALVLAQHEGGTGCRHSIVSCSLGAEVTGPPCTTPASGRL